MTVTFCHLKWPTIAAEHCICTATSSFRWKMDATCGNRSNGEMVAEPIVMIGVLLTSSSSETKVASCNVNAAIITCTFLLLTRSIAAN